MLMPTTVHKGNVINIDQKFTWYVPGWNELSTQLECFGVLLFQLLSVLIEKNVDKITT